MNEQVPVVEKQISRELLDELISDLEEIGTRPESVTVLKHVRGLMNSSNGAVEFTAMSISEDTGVDVKHCHITLNALARTLDFAEDLGIN